ncbi:head-tail connector protein [Sinirhodobacter huangdaonensis]|uniref:head-tail connector protein n=1 Tax=Paenirhodobacter huangdaonensis TaxID=2501515 RepID=UPI001EEF9B2A|nr:head-tail connector protein [Sinirhodobacter huangdaonensis]
MTLATELLSQAKAHARIDHDDEDDTLTQMLATALADVAHAAAYDLPATLAELPADLAFAACDQFSLLYDNRGGATERDRPLGLSLAASRICARYRGVSLGEPEVEA